MARHEGNDGGGSQVGNIFDRAGRAFDHLAALVNNASDLGNEAKRISGLAPGGDTEGVKIELLRKQQRFINAVVAQPKTRAAVLRVYSNPGSDDKDDLVALVSYQGQQLEVSVPKDMNVKGGDQVALSSTTLGVTGLVGGPCYLGAIGVVSHIISEDRIEISLRGEKRTVLSGYPRETLAVGDRVVVDNGALIVLENLGKGTSEFQFSGDVDLSWDRIVGCTSAKQKLRDAIVLPYERPDIFAHYHDEPAKGILLVGTPGCGKTMLLRAAATAHRTIHGNEALVLYIKGAELLRGIVGETEEAIRQLFAIPRAHFEGAGIRGLLIIDEAEALLPKRGSGRSSDVEKTNVATFLGEMGGMDSKGNPIMLLATNRPDMLDDAITRDERIDEVIAVSPPTRDDTPAFFALYLKNAPLSENSDKMAQYATEEFFSSKYVLASVKRKSTGVVEPFTLAHVVNGAMLAGIVRRAKASARNRDLANTKKGDSLGVITRDDIRAGILDALEKNKHLDYQKSLIEFVRGFKGDLAEPDEVLKTMMG